MGHGGIFGNSSLGTLGADDSNCGLLTANAASQCAIVGANPGGCAGAVYDAVSAGCMSSPDGELLKKTGTMTGATKATTLTEQTIVGGSDFSGQPCNSPAVIQMVQGAIKTTADGKWGPASQTALAKAGGTFQSYAPGCTGNPPSYGAITGGGGGGTVTTTYAPPPAPPVAASAMSGLLSKPIVWVGLAMAAVGGYVLLTGKKRGGKVKKNARKRRKVKIVKVSWGGTRRKGK